MCKVMVEYACLVTTVEYACLLWVARHGTVDLPSLDLLTLAGVPAWAVCGRAARWARAQTIDIRTLM